MLVAQRLRTKSVKLYRGINCKTSARFARFGAVSAAEKIADLSVADQREVVDKGKSAIVQKAGEIRKEQKKEKGRLFWVFKRQSRYFKSITTINRVEYIQCVLSLKL